MPIVDTSLLKLGAHYSREELAKLWGYKGREALSRGVVTPAGTNDIILFVTREKQAGYEQYKNELVGDRLNWEGPTDHHAEQRMISPDHSEERIHLFFRERHHTDFVYYGQLKLVSAKPGTGRVPSKFVFQLMSELIDQPVPA